MAKRILGNFQQRAIFLWLLSFDRSKESNFKYITSRRGLVAIGTYKHTPALKSHPPAKAGQASQERNFIQNLL